MQGHAALGENERLIVAMLHQCDIRLIVHDAGKHIVGGYRHCESFTLPEPCDGFVGSTRLREQHSRQ